MTKEELFDKIDRDNLHFMAYWNCTGCDSQRKIDLNEGFLTAKSDILNWLSNHYDEIVGDNANEEPGSVLFQVSDDESIVLYPDTVNGIVIETSGGYTYVKIYTNDKPRSAIYYLECGKVYKSDSTERARVLKAKLEKELAKRGIEIVDLRGGLK